MNLVQIQEQLKDMPAQAIQAYMNGSNPQVPPYLAAAELQRRQSLQQRQQNMQGAAQGKQPSVKEQLEQASGLIGLQAQRSQQGMQQMAQMAQSQPMPATEQTPQPEDQPEPEVAMANGGIVSIPVRESMFRDGGVVGYQEGGQTMSAAPGALADLIKRRDAMRKMGLNTTKLDQQIAAMQGTQAPGAAPAQAPVPKTAAEMLEPAWRTATEAAGTAMPTAEGQIEQQGKLEEAAGMRELLRRMQGEEETYKKSIEGRGLENLIRTLSAPAGPESVGLTAAQNAAAARDADLAFRQKMLDRYGEVAKDRFGALTRGLGDEKQNVTNLRQAGVKGLEGLYGSRQQAEDAAAQRKTYLQATEMQMRGGRGAGSTFKNVKAAADLEAKQLTAALRELAEINKKIVKSGEDKKRVEALQQEIFNRKAALRSYQEEFGYVYTPSTATETLPGATGAMGAGSSGKPTIDFLKIPAVK